MFTFQGHTRWIRKMIVIAIFGVAMNVFGQAQTLYLPVTRIGNPADSLLIDSEGNRYPIKKMLDNNVWMTVNLKLNRPGSYCYENQKSNCEQYGRLYTWEAAQKGCSQLGEGWRLPSMDEWRQLAKSYIKMPVDSIEERKEGFKVLLVGGSSSFNAMLGGGRGDNDNYGRVDAHGFYWTSTETNSSTAWFCNFGKGSQSLYRQNNGTKSDAFSVRCVKSN